MPIDPAVPPASNAHGRLLERVASLEKQLRDLTSLMQGGTVQQIPVVAALGAAGRKGRMVMLDSDNHVYKDDGSAWVDIG